MVISRPCQHPDCPPRDGFIRGQYESVEFIREVPIKNKKTSSTTDLLKNVRPREASPPLEKEVVFRNVEQNIRGSTESLPNTARISSSAAQEILKESRKRGKTISFSPSRARTVNEEDDDESNPVEWIMITRSDPGGSVPRFMVERGTPGSIVADASKFLDWACKKQHPEDEIVALEKGDIEHVKSKKREELEAYETNGRLAGLDGAVDGAPDDVAPPITSVARRLSLNPTALQEAEQGGIFSTVANAAYASIENYAPQAVVDRLPGHQQTASMSASAESNKESGLSNATRSAVQSPTSSVSSLVSFASAEDHFDDTLSTKSAASQAKSSNSKDASHMSPLEKELAKLNQRKIILSEKLAKAREKEMKDKEELTSKEEERLRKAEEKHAREVQKQEEKYKKEVAKLEAKRQKEASQLEARKRKAEDKDEKARLTREREEMKQQLEVVSRERDILREQVGALQKENTSLVVRMGKMDDGRTALREIKKEVESVGRSRSGSLRREKGKEATILGGDKKEGVEAMQ